MRYKDLRIVTPKCIILNGFIEIENDFIKDFGAAQVNEEGISLKGLTVMSGFIDMHTHGLFGDDFMDQDEEALKRISLNLLKEGTTAFLATTMTDTAEAIKKALTVINKAHFTGAKYLGIHLEGPFLNKHYHGAQNEATIIKGSKSLFNTFQEAAQGDIKLVTLAPEVQDKAFLESLISEGIILSMGHTNATKDDFEKAYDLGIKRMTHCFNAMKPIHHRDIGALGMALLKDDVMCEVIADGKHVSYEAIHLLKKVKNKHITMITDAIRAKGMKNGTYLLGPNEITLNDQGVFTKDNHLAGSTLFMNQALKNMVTNVTDDLTLLTRYLSYNPAIALNLKQMGEIKKGYYADLVFLNKDFEVKLTMVNGQVMINHLKEL